MATENFRELRPRDLEDLAPRMRPADAAEILASCGKAPLEGLRASVATSALVMALELGGELAAVFGVAGGPRPSILAPTDFDIVWSLSSTVVDRHPRAFWRASQLAIRELLVDYPVLVNAIDARYAAALRWAARLGAEVLPAIPWGVSGLAFHPVIWRSHV